VLFCLWQQTDQDRIRVFQITEGLDTPGVIARLSESIRALGSQSFAPPRLDLHYPGIITQFSI